MAQVTSPDEVIISTYADFREAYERRLGFIHRGSVQQEDLPKEHIALLGIYGNQWYPVRFEPAENTDKFDQVMVMVVHDGGDMDGKPFAFPGCPSLSWVANLREKV